MKKGIKLLTVLSSFSLLISGCNSNNNETKKDDDNKINPGDEDTKAYTYGDKVTYDGYITSSLSFDFLSNIGLDLDLYSGYVTFTYQTVNETLESKDYYKAIKFHLNVDLYSMEETYESSLLTSSLLPLISDFKYVSILNNVTDLDVYYGGDGYLYTTISKFKDNSLPSRNDRDEIKAKEREIIGTNKFDVTSILSMLVSSEESEASSSSLSFNIKDIFSTLGAYLEGLSINIGDFNYIIDSTNITFLSDGIKINFEENGLDAFGNIFAKLINFVLPKLDLGITIDSSLIDFNDINLEISSSNFIFQIEDKNSLKPILDLSFKRNDTKELNIEPSINLEEDYLIQTQILEKVDALYDLYNNYEISSDFDKKMESAIANINSLSKDKLKRVDNLNNYLGYSLLSINKDTNKYVSLNEKENINELYNKLETAISYNLNSDYYYLNAYSLFNEVYTSKYSSTTINNLIKKLENEKGEKYTTFKNNISTYLTSFLSNSYQNIKTALETYENGDKTIDNKKEVLETIYKNTVFDSIILSDGKEVSLKNIGTSSKVANLSNEIISNMMSYFNISNPLDESELTNKVYNLVIDYFDELSITFNKISSSEIKKYNEYSSYLLLNDNDDIYSIFNLIGSSQNDLKKTIKRKDDSLISSLLYRVNKFAKERIDEVLTLSQVYYLLNETILTTKENKLDSIYNMLNVYISSSLFKKYESSLTYIDQYYLLKEALKEQKANLGL